MKKNTTRSYAGIHNEEFGGLNSTGNIIRDAWVFGFLAETETCEGWSYDRIQEIYDQVSQAWQPYGHLAISPVTCLTNCASVTSEFMMRRSRGQRKMDGPLSRLTTN